MADNNAKRTSTYRFSKYFAKYDRLNNIISFEQHKVWRKHVMKEMRVKKTALHWTYAVERQIGQLH